MSLLSRLFGKAPAAAPAPETVAYNGYRITPEPMPDGGQFRLAARIEAEIEGSLRQHHLIRADLYPGRDTAAEAAIVKARQVIDQMGARLFE